MQFSEIEDIVSNGLIIFLSSHLPISLPPEKNEKEKNVGVTRDDKRTGMKGKNIFL